MAKLDIDEYRAWLKLWGNYRGEWQIEEHKRVFNSKGHQPKKIKKRKDQTNA